MCTKQVCQLGFLAHPLMQSENQWWTLCGSIVDKNGDAPTLLVWTF